VELARAVAISFASGPEPALDLVDQLAETGVLAHYHLFYSVRGDLLDRLGRHADAGAEFNRAATLAMNVAERELSERRARASLERASATPTTKGADSHKPPSNEARAAHRPGGVAPW